MIARGSLWLPLAILLMLAALSFWIERAVQVSDNGEPDHPDRPGRHYGKLRCIANR